jgi:predicted amidohydrolase YtcJ
MRAQGRVAVSPAGAPDAIFHNARVVTVDRAFAVREAFAIQKDRFVAVGDNRTVLALAGPDTRVVDLQGRTVLPGLADNHNHQYRAAWTTLRGIEMTNISSVRDMVERIRAAAASAKPGQTILAGAGWNPRTLAEKRPPSRTELDAAAPSHSVVVVRSRGQAFLNTAALKAAGIASDTGMVEGNEQVAALMERLAPPLTHDDRKTMILEMQRRQLAMGLTSIRELSLAPDIMRTYFDLWREGALTIRVSMGIEAQASDAPRMDEMLRHWGVGPGFGDQWLRLDSVAEFGIDSGTAEADLRDPPATPHANRGPASRITAGALRDAMLTMHRYGWRPAIHVVGDKALDMVLDAYEAADRAGTIRGRRWVVEHAEVVQPDQMERLARLGVLVSAQIQPYQDAADMVRDWGVERAGRAVPVRELLEHGVSVSSGTDFPARTNNPFVNLSFYVTRRTMDGTVAGPSQKVSRQDALRMITINNAYLTFEEHVKGSIEAGKLADFVVISGDVMTVPDDEIHLLRVLETYVGGVRRYPRD